MHFFNKNTQRNYFIYQNKTIEKTVIFKTRGKPLILIIP